MNISVKAGNTFAQNNMWEFNKNNCLKNCYHGHLISCRFFVGFSEVFLLNPARFRQSHTNFAGACLKRWYKSGNIFVSCCRCRSLQLSTLIATCLNTQNRSAGCSQGRQHSSECALRQPWRLKGWSVKRLWQVAMDQSPKSLNTLLFLNFHFVQIIKAALRIEEPLWFVTH